MGWCVKRRSCQICITDTIQKDYFSLSSVGQKLDMMSLQVHVSCLKLESQHYAEFVWDQLTQNPAFLMSLFFFYSSPIRLCWSPQKRLDNTPPWLPSCLPSASNSRCTSYVVAQQIELSWKSSLNLRTSFFFPNYLKTWLQVSMKVLFSLCIWW